MERQGDKEGLSLQIHHHLPEFKWVETKEISEICILFIYLFHDAG